MASIPTMNAWIEELAASLQPVTPASLKTKRAQRRAIDTFRRQVQRHTFTRTNQFDVSDKLDGLEEKFQVMNREDLSDALYSRRIELRRHDERWVPDVLDLLLRLSNNPLAHMELGNLLASKTPLEAPILLKWADIEADDDDPLDRRDPIWKIPSFSDLSSDENEIDTSAVSASPMSVKSKGQSQGRWHAWSENQVYQDVDISSDLDLQNLRILANKETDAGPVTEIQLIRQILVMIQGYNSTVSEPRGTPTQLCQSVRLKTISNEVLQGFFQESLHVPLQLDVVDRWANDTSSIRWIQTIQQSAQHVIQDFISAVSGVEESMLHPCSLQIASLLSVFEVIERLGKPLTVFAEWVRQVEGSDCIATLNTLHQTVCEYYYSGDTAACEVLVPVFVRALVIYMESIHHWLESGTTTSTTEPFFVRAKSGTLPAAGLWHDWFELNPDDNYRAPTFLEGFVQNVFVAGKTVAFINNITLNRGDRDIDLTHYRDLAETIRSLATNTAIPFPAALTDVIHIHLASLLSSKTLILKDLLDTRCGMSRTLDAFEYLYLRKNGMLLDAVESRVFDRIDRCMESWNDRFLVADMIEDVFAGVDSVDLKSISVRSIHTSSRSMESRRRSVRILAALVVDYAVPWPVANIIPQDSLNAYRRIALLFTQIRRAKYVLERTAFTHVNATPIGDDRHDQLLAQTTAFALIQFVNTLNSHFGTAVAEPLTSRMRHSLRSAGSVDGMIAVHATYVSGLEFACLTGKSLGVLRDTLIGLLDLCVRFADLVSTPVNDAVTAATTTHRGGGVGGRTHSPDFETGSFVSAQSRHRHRRDRRRGQRRERHRSKLANSPLPSSPSPSPSSSSSSSDDDDEHIFGGGNGDTEGYSSFIVLDPETSIIKEIKTLRSSFRHQVDFFVAGLRGAAAAAAAAAVTTAAAQAKAGGVQVVMEMQMEMMQMLADKLEFDWKYNKSGSGRR